MKGTMLLRLVCSLAALLLIFGCATAPRVQEKPASGDFAVITDVKVEDNSIVITSDRPFIYTLYSEKDPYKITLDIPDMKAGAFSQKIVSDKAGITEIVPRETESPQGLKFDILLQNPSKVTPLYANNTLTLAIKRDDSRSSEPGEKSEMKSGENAGAESSAESPSAAPAAVAEENVSDAAQAPAETKAVTPEKVQTQESEPPLPDATEIEKVEIGKSMGQLNVAITGNGSMRPNVFPLDSRIVVDIPGVKMKARVPSDFSSPLRAIRVGRYRDKVRIVLDLRKKTTFDVAAKGNTVEISLGKKVLAEAPPPASPQPAAVESAAPAAEATPAGESPGVAGPPATAPQAQNEKQNGARYHGENISLDFQDAEVGQLIRLLADTRKPEPYNLVLDPSVKGKRIPNLKLMNVPWDQALDIILKSADLGYRIDGNVLWVAPSSTFAKLAAEKEKAKETQAQTAELYQEIIQINYAEADKISQAITDAKLLSPRGNITKDTRMNTLIIKDTQDSIARIKDLVKIMDVSKPQVMIEAKLVQVSNDYNETLGIRWGGAINNPSFPTPISGNFSVNTPTDAAGSTIKVPGGALGLTIGHANTLKVDLSLSALESIGKSKTLSNPKILTMDNEKATIQQGSTFYIATVSQAGTQTQAQTATLSLEVTPKITPDGYVQLKVTATDNSLVSVNPPVVDTKSMTTQALVKDGETLVLGGIYTSTQTENEDSVPLLGRIPGLGWLFKTKSLVGPTVKELLIFITPTVIAQHM
jgi:type IV pilus secretin PilQ/predicted competence protein